MSKRSSAVLDTPEPEYAPDSSRSSSIRRPSTKSEPRLRRDTVEDFASNYNDGDEEEDRPRRSSRPQLKLKFRSRVPTSVLGRVATGIALLFIVGSIVGLLMVTRTFLLHDPRFMIQSPAAIEIQGNKHLTRAQLLSIFGEDVERNIFRISLDDRQAELEALPWVQHATLMRLLPSRIRVAIVERVPVAFVRQGGHIGLVDGQGVLLDMASASQAEQNYSFPVVTGITASDPASTRLARMKIFERFTADLDSTGEKISEHLSDVDLSNPEDVKALIPDHSTEVLVHFGDEHFLDRYRKFQELLPQWHTQYPNLASVDMRYEREVVLDMAKPGKTDADAQAFAAKLAPKTDSSAKPAAKSAVHALAKAPIHVPAKSQASKPASHATAAAIQPKAEPPHATGVTSTPASPVALSSPSASAAARSSYPVAHSVTTLPAKSADTKSAANKPAATKSAPRKTPLPSSPVAGALHAKPAAGKPLLPISGTYHPPQVATP